MRTVSSFVVLICLLFTGLLAGRASAQEADAPSPKKVTRIRQGGNITAKALINKVNPKYPEEARKRLISGTVRLHAIIARDGSIAQLEAISGDPLLARASLDAVRKWKYRVTSLNGEPVEVDTTIDVVFSFNR